MYSIPWLGGASNNDATAWLLWPDFEATWPLLAVPMAEKFEVAKEAMGAWGLPAINTSILLLSGLTVTLAHYALKRVDRVWLVYWLFATVALGFLFVGLQALEYMHAYEELNLRMFFPQELDAMLEYNGFSIEDKFGDYEETPFASSTELQLVICSKKR